MKNASWIVALLVVALVLGAVAVVAVGCGSTGESTTEGTTGDTTEETTASAFPDRIPVSGVSADAEVISAEDTGQTYTGDDALVLSLGMPSSASLYHTYLVTWMDAVRASSNGRVDFTDYTANTLVKEEQQIDSVLNGTSDITAFQPDWAPGVFPLGELLEMPMLFPDMEIATRVTYQLMDEVGPKELQDFHVMGVLYISGVGYGGTQPLHVPSESAGMRLRSGGAVETEIIEAIGGTPVEAGTDSLATQIDRNAFDGTFLSWAFHAGNTNRWATDWTSLDLYLRPLILVMSKDTWESLPAEVQKAFDDNSNVESVVKYLARETLYIQDNALVPDAPDKGLDKVAIEERAASLGTEIYYPTDAERAEWVAAVRPVIENWVDRYAGKSNFDPQAVVDRAMELVSQYTGSAGETTTTGE